jgi:hypothetical protein
LKSARANSSRKPISKNSTPIRADGVPQGVGPEFKPSTTKKKKRAKRKLTPNDI